MDRRLTPSPPLMAASVNGPMLDHEFWRPFDAVDRSTSSPTATPLPPPSTVAHPNGTAAGAAAAARSFSRSPVRNQTRAASGPALSAATHALNSAKSNPVLLPLSRQPGSVKDIANKFNQGAVSSGGTAPPALTIRTGQDRSRRAVSSKSATSRSPTSTSGIRSDSGSSGMVKLQKRRPGQPRSPQKSPTASFDTSSSFSSNATLTSARSQSNVSSKRLQSPAKPAAQVSAKPLFGELTADGWHGNFDLGNYASLPQYSPTYRRQSEGSIALGHGRSHSHQDITNPALLSPRKQTLQHKRSRSEMDAMKSQTAPSMPNLNAQAVPSLYPTPPPSGTRNALRKNQSVPKLPSPSSRIPVSNGRRQSQDSSGLPSPYSRPASAMSGNGGRNRLSKSPTRRTATSKENNTMSSSTPRNRYQPPPISTTQSSKMLSAKIVAPLPKTSPPLRSSRPRQPVSSATTSASRARAAERFQGPNERDGRRPSEQWLGKPYDAQKERSRRRIPELGKVDFAERRARIQKAISQNLEESQSQENLKTPSRRQSKEPEAQLGVTMEDEAQNSVDQHQADEMDRETEAIDCAEAIAKPPRTRGLSLDTAAVPDRADIDPEPMTGVTEFEVDESPVLGYAQPPREPVVEETQPEPVADELPTLLTSATYQPPTARAKTPPPPIEIKEEAPAEPVQSPSVLENAMRMRERSPGSISRDGTEFAEDSPSAVPSAVDSASDMSYGWGRGHSVAGDQGSINIMLDDDPLILQPNEAWPKHFVVDAGLVKDHVVPDVEPSHEYSQAVYTANDYTESPVNEQDSFPDEALQDTPRKVQARDETLKPTTFQPAVASTAASDSVKSDEAVARALDQYQTTGIVAPEMFEYMQNHSVDLQRASANAGSDAIMIQNLMDSMMDLNQPKDESPQTVDKLVQPFQYEIPAVTPDTPPDAAMATGTAVVYSNDSSYDVTPEEEVDDDEDPFQRKIREADEAWEREQRGEGVMLGAVDDSRPMPPPKDIGYTPRSSTGPNSAIFPPNLTEGLRISTSDGMTLPDIHTALTDIESPSTSRDVSSPPTRPPLPKYAPPPPPSPLGAPLPFDIPEVPPIPATYSERGSSEFSPRVRKNLWGPSGSSRPSVDSQRAPASQPQPKPSFSESTRQSSVDTNGESVTKLGTTTSQGPEQKRLLKRRHIIKELLDTENTYHQDLKIIEDIYKATVADLVTPEDRKTLFGNCDEIERFSLHFYDEMRRAVLPVYVPPKHMRWANKRGSYSTTQSDGTGQTSVNSSDTVDDERDRATTVGHCFLENLQRMDQVYGAYLRNHDAANQRLSALKNTATVKCWLDECHNNASDITSAWDLDSLLVKPTQRVSKYPMLLQQLLETTPADHPDYEALKTAAKDSVGMLTRINDAKKRADIVDQIINRKGKDTDVRSGIAKAFGRRTEKLKERVGIAEVFQDPEFDELSHKFGGHFIRLQICMRDVQDYLHRIDRAMELINNCAASLELYTDVSASSLPEIESKWRRYGQAVREISTIAFPDHKAAVNKRVIAPMVTCIKLHDGPQNAINNRKKRIVDYAKCKSIEKRGEKPDRKTLDASEKYLALNDQLKIDLPKLYTLTASLVQGCLACFLDIQLIWYNMWERKLRPILEAADIPASIQQIEPAFLPDFNLVKDRLTELAICNGALLAESANSLSVTTSLNGDSEQPSYKRPSTLDHSKRTLSVGSDASPYAIPDLNKRHSSGFGPAFEGPPLSGDGRLRSNSSLSTRGTPSQMPGSGMSASRQWSNTSTPNSSFSTSRPTTGTHPPSMTTSMSAFHQPPPRVSVDTGRSPRPNSATTYFTAQHELSPDTTNRASLFQSALPPDISTTPQALARPTSSAGSPPTTTTTDDRPVLFVCASLFEFSIDKTRREGGHPYLTYVQGEVFDVVAQKGELWLARNQDDGRQGLLGWIWEQHFVILSQD